MVKVCLSAVCTAFCLCSSLIAQSLPDDELQINFSGYFDSFDVSIVYPNVTLTRKISDSMSLTGRYLVDMVSAASIKSGGTPPATETPVSATRVDVVTSASGRRTRRIVTSTGAVIDAPAPLPVLDDVRHELGLGMTRLIAGRSVSLNGIYSTENDYTSATLAGTLNQGFAKKNSSLQLGLVHSWDSVFPATKDWKRDKNVTAWSANLGQVLSTRLIVQVLASYTTESGHLSDDYQLVPIEVGDSTASLDPVHPDRRIRKAAAARFKYRLTDKSSLQLGYRFYWDTWDVDSHTFSGNYQRYLSPQVILGVGLRSYFQTRAFFFKLEYARPEEFRTVDIKLDSGFSNELQFNLTLNGGDRDGFLLNDERLQYNFGLSIYQRHSDTPYWFNDSKDLVSADLNVGIRYRF